MKQRNWWAQFALVTAMAACGGGDNTQSPGPSAAAGAASQAGAAVDTKGEEIYNNFCFSCHNPGLSGAPKLGDTEAWGPRIAKGNALLLEATIAGVQPAMPPRGMCFDCSDEDLAAAIEYMVQSSR